MPRSHEEILANLDPGDPASIRALIDFHHATFGDARMEDPPAGDPKGGNDGGDPKGGDPKGGNDQDDKPLGPAGEKALKAERDARQALERQVAELKAGQFDPAKIAEAFGIKVEGAKPSETDVLAQVQQQLADLKRDNLVLRVVSDKAHTITDADDIALIAKAGDEADMRKLAARLAKAGGGSGSGSDGEKPKDDWRTRGLPKPDPSQALGGGDARPSSIEAVREQRRAERAKRREQRGA